MTGLIAASVRRAAPYAARVFWPAFIALALAVLGALAYRDGAEGPLDWRYALVLAAALAPSIGGCVIVAAASIRAYRDTIPPTPHL